MSGAYEWHGQFVIVKSEFMYVCMYMYFIQPGNFDGTNTYRRGSDTVRGPRPSQVPLSSIMLSPLLCTCPCPFISESPVTV